jgi:hypothetical protein
MGSLLLLLSFCSQRERGGGGGGGGGGVKRALRSRHVKVYGISKGSKALSPGPCKLWLLVSLLLLSFNLKKYKEGSSAVILQIV